MADAHHAEEATSLPFQGPHWRHEPAPVTNDALVPLRLHLRPGRGVIEVTRSGLVFGRHSSADVRLPLPNVSRRHCRFVCHEGRWQVIDLDSLNGVYVNDALVRQAELRHRDTVRLGGFVFEVDLQGGEHTVHLADTAPADGVLRRIVEHLPPEEQPLRRAS